MAIGPLANVFGYLQNLGFFDVILPFAVIFAIVWAMLQKINIFGEASRKINGILALSISLIAIFPHVTGLYQEFDIVNFINTTFPQMGLILIGLVLLMILMGVVGGNTSHTNFIIGFAGIAGVILLLIVIWRSLFPYQSPTWLSFMDDPNTQALLVIILVFGLIVYFVTRDNSGYVEKDDPARPGQKIMVPKQSGATSARDFLDLFYGKK